MIVLEEALRKINTYFNNRAFDNLLIKEKNRYYQIKSSISVLNEIQTVIDEYEKEAFSLINLFGLFQYLFISIDAVYDLAYAITNNKWLININNNPKLREVKYIRNECIGHPTYRQYGKNEVGYCYIDFSATNKDYLSYYSFLEDDSDVVKKLVDIKDMLKSFSSEVTITLNDIYQYIIRDRSASKVYLTPKVKRVYEEYNSSMNISNRAINNIISIYQDNYHLDKNSKSRFIWRLEIIKDLMTINTYSNNEKMVIDYLIRKQLKKVISMAIDADRELYGYKEETSPMPVHEPTLIKYGWEYLKKTKLIEVIKDPNHPLFDQVVTNILKHSPSIVCELFAMIKREEGSQSFVYAIGSALANE